MATLENFTILNKQFFYPRICPPGIRDIYVAYLIDKRGDNEALTLDYHITDNHANIDFENGSDNWGHRVNISQDRYTDRLIFINGTGQREIKRFYVTVNAYFESDGSNVFTESFTVELC